MAWWETTLDLISAPLSQPVATFTRGIWAGASAVQASRERISKDVYLGKIPTDVFKTVGTTLATTAVLGGATLAIGAPAEVGAVIKTATSKAVPIIKSTAPKILPMIKTGAKKIATGAGGIALKHPFKTILVGGLVTTPGGRNLIKKVPGKIFRTGQIIGDVSGGQNPNLTITEALTGAGLLAGGVVLGRNLYNKYVSGKKGGGASPQTPLKSGSPIIPAPVGAVGSPAIEATPVIKEEKPTEAQQVGQPMIKITNKPKINIAIAN